MSIRSITEFLKPVIRGSIWVTRVVKTVMLIIMVPESGSSPALNVLTKKGWNLEKENKKVTALGNPVMRDNSWTRLKVVKTVQQITGAHQGTQLIPAPLVHQEQRWALDWGNKKVTAHISPATKECIWTKQMVALIVPKMSGVQEELLGAAPNVLMIKKWQLEPERKRPTVLGSHVLRDKASIRTTVAKTVQQIIGAHQET